MGKGCRLPGGGPQSRRNPPQGQWGDAKQQDVGIRRILGRFQLRRLEGARTRDEPPKNNQIISR